MFKISCSLKSVRKRKKQVLVLDLMTKNCQKEILDLYVNKICVPQCYEWKCFRSAMEKLYISWNTDRSLYILRLSIYKSVTRWQSIFM